MKSNGRWFTVFRTVQTMAMLLVVAGIGTYTMAALAQPETQPVASAMQQEATAAVQPSTTNRVTINVSGGSIADVLSAFSRQTGRSIVIGSGVTNLVTIRLNNTPWQEALDVVLKPYGYGYKLVGDTVVVNNIKDIASMEQVEPLVAEIFTLKYVEAADVLEIIQGLLTTNRGTVNILYSQPEAGWEFGGSKPGAGSTATSLGAGGGEKRERVGGGEKKKKSKTLVVKDTRSIIDRIRDLIASIDTMPMQVLIEARFVEVNSNFLRDIGFEWGTGANGASSAGPQAQNRSSGGNLFGLGAQLAGGSVEPAAFGAASASLEKTQPFNAGMAMRFQQLTGTQFEILMHMLQEDNSLNILSSPRVLAMNNQEATIKVGDKYPIIESNVTGGTGGSAGTTSTTLKYYEDIGIQLNVVPQVCGEKNVSLLVHPAVTELIGKESGVVNSAGSETAQTRYPVLSTREAETQIILQSGSTVVIGGLLKKRDASTKLKTPFFGDIPLLGWLFRRDTRDNDKLDLLIFLTATIMPSAGQIENDNAQAAKARLETQRLMDVAARAQVDAERAVATERAARIKAESQAVKETEARAAAERRADKAGRDAEKILRDRAQDKAQREAARKAERAKIEAEKKSKAEAEAKAKEQARVLAAQEAEKARLAAEQKSKADAEVRARAEAERLAAEDARVAKAAAAREAEKARLMEEQKAKAEKARLAAEAEEKIAAEREARDLAAREAERVRIAADKKAKAEAEKAEKARLAAEAKAKKEAAEKLAAEQEAKERAAREAEKVRIAAEKKAKAESEAREANAKRLAAESEKAEKARVAAEAKAKQEAAEMAAAAQMAKERAAREAEEQRLAAEKKARVDAEKKALAENKAKARAAREAEKARIAAEKKAEKARLAAEAKAKEEAEEKIAAEQEAKERAAREAEKARVAEAKKLEAAKKLAEEQRRFEANRRALEANAQAADAAQIEKEAKSLIQKLPEMPVQTNMPVAAN